MFASYPSSLHPPITGHSSLSFDSIQKTKEECVHIPKSMCLISPLVIYLHSTTNTQEEDEEEEEESEQPAVLEARNKLFANRTRVSHVCVRA